MKTKIALLLLSLVLISCDFSFGVQGNGNVIEEERTISESFNAIEVSRGMDVYLTHKNENRIKVEADENLHDIIVTEVDDNVLKIYASENISSSSKKHVYVFFKNIEKITATSGSDVYSVNTIKSESLKLNTTSGSDMELDLDVDIVDCKSTSGSDLTLTGKANEIYAKATSGSDIKAKELITNICNASVTSGADITLHVTKKLHATASSGGNINYIGNPSDVTKNDGTSGNIRKL